MHRPLLPFLALLPPALASLSLQPRQSTNSWHISTSYVFCDPYSCSYQLHVSGTDTGALPYFEADCTGNVPIGDSTLHQCNLVGAGSRTGVLVNEVDVTVELYPGGGFGSRVVVQLEFQRPGRGPTEYWSAEQDGSYGTFSQDLLDYDVVPLQAAAVA